jgi:serine/threonine protein kinase
MADDHDLSVREQRLMEVIAAYYEAGEPPERAELLARHPDLAASLVEFFGIQEDVRKLVEPLRPIADAASEGQNADDETLRFVGDRGPSIVDTEPATSNASGEFPTGTHVRYFGDYELFGEIARGGMGVVYRACQRSLNRPVALKMILAGRYASPDDLLRFRNEAEAVANLDHPNIVPIHEVGQHEGHSYFAMKLIEGGSLGEHLPEFTLDPKSAARLLAVVARAVHHAHQRGVLHRDLKPSNILLDAEGQPHVVDFGLAKRVEGDPELTVSGAIVGSAPYMSAEQASGKRKSITTATDIYGLGAILYAMLTARPPFQADSVAETIEQVKEREPDPPSGQNRRVDRDLQTICLKCLDKDPQRRYVSALALAEDLDHWLKGEPIAARPVTRLERSWRWCRRNPALAGLTLVIFALMLAGVTGLIVSNRMISKRSAEVQAESDRVTAIMQFLTDDLLGQAEPSSNAVEDHVSLLEVLDRAAEKVGNRFTDRPDREENVRATIASAYHNLASWEKAERQWRAVLESSRRRLGPDARRTLVAQRDLGHTITHRGRPADALALLEPATDGLARVLGPDHSETLRSRGNLASAYRLAGHDDKAIALFESTLKLEESKLGPDHPNPLITLGNLADCYRAAGQSDKAIELFEGKIKLFDTKLGPDHPMSLMGRTVLANNYVAAGRTDEAIALHEETLKRLERRLGPGHRDTLVSRGSLADAYLKAGRIPEAIRLGESTLKQIESTVGPDHFDACSVRNNLADAYFTDGRRDAAIALNETNLRLLDSKLGPDHPFTLRARGNLAKQDEEVRRTEDAIRVREGTLKLVEPKLGHDHPLTLQNRNNLAMNYWRAGRFDLSVPLFELTLKQKIAKFGADDPETLKTQANLGVTYVSAGRPEEGARVMEEALRRAQGRSKAMTAVAWLRPKLAAAYDASGQFARSEPIYREELETARKSFGSGDLRAAGAAAQLSWNFLMQEKWGEAESVLRECLAVREKTQPDDWTTFNTRSVLGGALLGQGKKAEAEPLLLSGYQGMKAREAKIPSKARDRLSEAAARVVRLYEALGKPEQAAEWQRTTSYLPAELPADVFAHPGNDAGSNPHKK